MNESNSRYSDFSADDWLQSEFDPNSIDDWTLQMHGRQIQRHLALKNPISSVQGLLGFQITIMVAHMRRIEKTLDMILVALIAFAFAFGWFAFV